MKKGFCNVVTNCCGKQTITFNQKGKNISKDLPTSNANSNSADVIIIGSGVAGTMAALSVDKAGSNFIMLESENDLGGTTLLSSNHYYFFNLTKSREIAQVVKNLNIPLIGQEFNNLPTGFDIKPLALKYMASCSYPDIYDENAQYLGMPADIYNKMSLFYDNGSIFIESDILPYVDTLRVQYNAITGATYNPMVYDPDMNALAAGFTLVQAPDQSYTATADTVVPGSFGLIPGYCYSVTDTPGFFSIQPADYFDKHDKQGTCIGRVFTFTENNGTSHADLSINGEWIRRIWQFLQVVNNRQLLTQRRVTDISEKDDGIVVTAVNPQTGEQFTYKARKGIVVATGGFSHNNDLITQHINFSKIFDSCSANGSRGDIIKIAEKNGWELSQMRHAFYNQRLLNNIGTTTPNIIFFTFFETVMILNKLGRRVCAETAKYNERTKVQFAWDPTYSFLNEYLFIVVDRYEYNIFNNIAFNQFVGAKAFSVDDITIPINTKIQTICTNIKSWFQSLPNLADFQIDDVMMANGFIDSLSKYQSYCSTGIDLEFARQNNDTNRNWLADVREILTSITKDTPITQTNDWRYNDTFVENLYGPIGKAYFDSIVNYSYTYPDGTVMKLCPDILLQPIIDPVVMVLVPCTLDTKGGPLSNADMKILASKGSYIAGNAGGSSFTVNAYWGGGATLGPALFGGWTAGANAANNDYQSSQDDKFGLNLNVVSFMDNAYPDRRISLTFTDPLSFTLACDNTLGNNFNVGFKLSVTRNESVPKDDDATSDWTILTPTIISSVGDYVVFKVVLPNPTFMLPGIYLVSFQMIKQNGNSLGPKFAIQTEMSVIQFNNINNYVYVGNVFPIGSIVLEQDSSSWTGKFKSTTVSGFPEVSHDQNMYIKYNQPSHNFNLAYGFQFDTLADVILFSSFVYSKGNGESWDGAALTAIAASAFNFTFDPSPPPGTKPNVVIVADLDIGFYQTWFGARYNVPNDDVTFPKNEVSNYAYISTVERTKNWFFNTTLTQTGKWSVYFFYCSVHRTSNDHYGWFLVNP